MERQKLRDSKRSKESILMAAEIEFAQKGLYGSRVDEIALKANINKRMIYEYFGSKEGLYNSVLLGVYARLGQQEIVLLNKKLSPIKAIEEIIEFYFEFLDSNPAYVSLILWENLNKAQGLKASEIGTRRNKALSLLRETINRGIADGVFRENSDVDQTVFSILTYGFSYFSNRYTLSKLFEVDFDDERNIKKRITHVTQTILAYLCTA